MGVQGATFTRDESRILSWDNEGTVRLWQASDGAAIRVMKPEESSSGVQGAMFNQDGSRILSWGDDGTLRLWQVSDGTAISRDEARGEYWGSRGPPSTTMRAAFSAGAAMGRYGCGRRVMARRSP